MQTSLPTRPRYCRCGHGDEVHQHHRRGTDCGACQLRCVRFRPVHRAGWIVACYVTAAAVITGGVLLIWVTMLRGWPIVALGLAIASSALASALRSRGNDELRALRLVRAAVIARAAADEIRSSARTTLLPAVIEHAPPTEHVPVAEPPGRHRAPTPEEAATEAMPDLVRDLDALLAHYARRDQP